MCVQARLNLTEAVLISTSTIFRTKLCFGSNQTLQTQTGLFHLHSHVRVVEMRASLHWTHRLLGAVDEVD
eukprot:m.262016 g.262016  ORF g.262016 m.262016 type:complete len:70 (+) comp44104_c0_seq1:245-454(+)